ncbi:MAG: hypothetical protein II670_09560 [Alphaproteobacteria bacterium]|nr:hypothetical protein [Alphaproteobacteria bacterium]
MSIKEPSPDCVAFVYNQHVMWLFYREDLKEIIMGLFNFFKKGGNFSLISEVVTTWYCGVCDHPKSNTLTLPQKLYCAGILDMITYIQSGVVDGEMIGECVRRAVKTNPNLNETNCLLSYIQEIEMLIFSIESPSLSKSQISREVLDHSDKIERTMLSVLNNASTADLMKTKPGVNNLLENADILNMILSFQI